MSRYKFETKHIRILRRKFLKYAIFTFQGNLIPILLQDIALSQWISFSVYPSASYTFVIFSHALMSFAVFANLDCHGK